MTMILFKSTEATPRQFRVDFRYVVTAAVVMCICCAGVVLAGPMCGCEHRYGLLMELYDATNGPQWTNSDGWGTIDPCNTNWFGVTCGSGDVIQVSMFSNRLRGELPASWWNMSNLQLLHLHYNTLTGTLPPGWSSMLNLESIYLHYNSLSGTLPPSWSNMTSIRTLLLTTNSLSGILPSSWSIMSSLQTVHLHHNNLSGTLPPSWSGMTSLQYLYAQNNNLTGPLPPSWSSMTSLFELCLHNNSFDGTLPPSWLTLTRLQLLFLSHNSLSGELPASWSSLRQLETLYVYNNALSGVLPAGWSNLSSLEFVDVSTNCFHGVVPATYASLGMLAVIDVCRTNITGGQEVLGSKAAVCSGTGGNTWPSYCRLGSIVTPTSSTSLSTISVTRSMSPSLVLTESSWGNGTTTHSPPFLTIGSRTQLTLSLSASHSPTQSLKTSTTSSLSLSPTVVTSHSSTASCWITAASASRSSSPTNTIVLSRTSSLTSQTAFSPSASSTGWTRSTLSKSRPSPTVTPTLSTWVCAVDPLDTIVSLSEFHSSGSTRPSVVITGGSGSFPTPLTALATITATPLQRSVVDTAPDLVFNLTISAPTTAARWVVADVGMGGQNLHFTDMSPNTALWHAVRLEAPARWGGWLPPGTPLFMDRAVELQVQLACDDAPVLIVELVVPAPGTPRDFAERVVVASEYSQLASLLAGGATSGSALGRTLAVRSMVMCDADAAVSGGVLDLGLTICADGVADSAPVSARSAVLSNYILVGCVSAVMLLLPLLWAHLRGGTCAHAMRELSFPSTLLPVCTIVIPSTSASVTLLLARLGSSPCVATDVVLALSGAVLVLISPAVVLATWRMYVFPSSPDWACVAKHTPPVLNGGSTNHLRLVLHSAFVRRWRWIATLTAPVVNDEGIGFERDNGRIRHAWVVLLEYRVVWYSALDGGLLATVAAVVVAGGAAHDSSVSCVQCARYSSHCPAAHCACPCTSIHNTLLVRARTRHPIPNVLECCSAGDFRAGLINGRFWSVACAGLGCLRFGSRWCYRCACAL